MKEHRRLEERELPSERRYGRLDVAGALSFVGRVATTAGSFAYCGWIAAGDVGAWICGTGVLVVLLAPLYSRSSMQESVLH
jgi:hypothetical protein